MSGRIGFVLGATEHGPMIINRLDFGKKAPDGGLEFGVGSGILEWGFYGAELTPCLGAILDVRKDLFGPGVVAIDAGANVGAYTIEWAKQMSRWGRVIAFEPQEPLFYALCGNIAINNIANAKATLAGVGEEDGYALVPTLDYSEYGTFGAVSLCKNVDVGQVPISYAKVPIKSIDGLGLERVDFIKLDVEGMEVAAIKGARETINRCKPIMVIEWHHSGRDSIESALKEIGYASVRAELDLICAPAEDPMLGKLREFIGQT